MQPRMNNDKINSLNRLINSLNRLIWHSNMVRCHKQAMLLEDDLIEEMK